MYSIRTRLNIKYDVPTEDAKVMASKLSKKIGRAHV